MRQREFIECAQLADHVDNCPKYVLSLNFVDALTLGQESEREMLDLVRRIPDTSI